MRVGQTFDELWATLRPIGLDRRTGGYRRFTWGEADATCRAWFTDAAERRGLSVHTDPCGNLWAWHGDPDADGPGVVTGSHLDSVPGGGGFDGPLGIASAFAALDLLIGTGVPDRPVGIVAFAEEEGGRFGVPCVGSRLLTGALDAETVRELTDPAGTTYAEAMRAAGHDPDRIGPDRRTLRRIGAFVELHIEQGKGLAHTGHPVGLGTGIWPHGRWRLEFTGRGDHAGTTGMHDRADPMLTYAMTALAANKRARTTGTRATFGRVEVEPGGANTIPSRVRGWLDARAGTESGLDELIGDVERQAQKRAARDGTSLEVRVESRTREVEFDQGLRTLLADRLARGFPDRSGRLPELATAAGHDAGILAAVVPTAMLFVRNPTGVSHAPAESADRADCLAGVKALAVALDTAMEVVDAVDDRQPDGQRNTG